jgi:hypothetical protein
MQRESLWQACLLLGMFLDLIGALLVLSAVIDFSSKRFHGQIQSEVAYIDTELVDAKQKAEVGLWFILAGFGLAFAKESRELWRGTSAAP